MKANLLFIFLLTYFALVVAKDHEIKMITDVINDSEKATGVVAHLCWKPSELVRLMSQLGNSKMKKSVVFVNKYWTNITEPQQREKLFVVADMNCPSASEVFKMANATRKFGYPYRWLIIGKPANDSTPLTSYFDGIHLLPDADVIISQKYDNDSFILKMLYKMKVYSKWITEEYGIWTTTDGLRKFEIAQSTISTRRTNFHREPIKAAMVIFDNRTIADPFDLKDVLTDIVTKSSFRQMDPLYGFLNASRTLVYSPTWGYNTNGSYGGMIADLMTGDAEIAGTVLIITWDRMQVVEYLSSPIPISIKFVFREPPLSYQNNLFLLPFKTTVWYCVGAFVLVLGFILYITALWENKVLGATEENSMDHTALKPNVGDIAILVISAVSQQGSSTELKGTLGRIVMFILFVAFLLLYSSYSASIVALLQSSSNQIRTLSDLLHSKLELGVEDTPYNRYFFPMATEPVRKAIYQTKIAPHGTEPKFMSLEEGVKNLQTKPFAFNMNVGVGYKLVEKYFHEHEKCGLSEIAYLYSSKTYITCRKNSPYQEIFKIGLFRIQEHGISNRENRLIFGRKPSCQARGGSFGSVNMVDFYPVLLMYLYGILLAFAFLAMEILVHRKGLFQGKVETTEDSNQL